MDELQKRAIKALESIANSEAVVGKNGLDRREVIGRVEKMAGVSYCKAKASTKMRL